METGRKGEKARNERKNDSRNNCGKKCGNSVQKHYDRDKMFDMIKKTEGSEDPRSPFQEKNNEEILDFYVN